MGLGLSFGCLGSLVGFWVGCVDLSVCLVCGFGLLNKCGLVVNWFGLVFCCLVVRLLILLVIELRCVGLVVWLYGEC